MRWTTCTGSSLRSMDKTDMTCEVNGSQRLCSMVILRVPESPSSLGFQACGVTEECIHQQLFLAFLTLGPVNRSRVWFEHFTFALHRTCSSALSKTERTKTAAMRRCDPKPETFQSLNPLNPKPSPRLLCKEGLGPIPCSGNPGSLSHFLVLVMRITHTRLWGYKTVHNSRNTVCFI